MPRVAALVLLLLLTGACSLAGTAGAATRSIPFVPVVAPAIGTCDVGSPPTPRGCSSPATPRAVPRPPPASAAPPPAVVLLVLAPDSSAAGTTVSVRRVEVVSVRGRRTLRVTVTFAAPPADALLAQVLTTPRAAVRLGAAPLPSAWTLVDGTGAVLARGRG